MAATPRQWTKGAMVAGLGLVSLASFTIGRATADSIAPTIRHGTVTTVNIDGTAFAVRPAGSDTATGYAVPALWIDAQGTIHEGDQAPCLAPLSRGAPITYGVVRVRPTRDEPGSDLAVWVRCTG